MTITAPLDDVDSLDWPAARLTVENLRVGFTVDGVRRDVVRGQTLSLKRREFVEAAHAMGVGGGGILRRHVVPNLLGPVVVYVTLLIPKVILIESFLSFLSLGVQEPMTSWGVLISEGQQNMQGAAYLLIFPSLFLISTLFALNFLGDGLRDALDPRDR